MAAKRLRLGARLLAATAQLPFRRLAKGPRHADWSAREEWQAAFVRTAVSQVPKNGFAWFRELESSLSLRSPLLRRVRFDRREVAGVDSVWCRVSSEPVAEVLGRERVMVYYHGGGYAVGSLATCTEIVARLALEVGGPVLVPLYRLAPEHPFPAAPEDCFAVYRWLLEQGQPASRLALAGDSAGGALALATLLQARDARLQQPAAAVLFSPWVDPEDESGSMVRNEGVDTIGRAFLRVCLDAYLTDETQRRHPWVAPIRAELRRLAPLLLQVGDAEIFLDQVTRFGDRAREAGVDARLEVHAGLFHTFQNLASTLPRAARATTQATAFLRRRLAD